MKSSICTNREETEKKKTVLSRINQSQKGEGGMISLTYALQMSWAHRIQE